MGCKDRYFLGYATTALTALPQQCLYNSFTWLMTDHYYTFSWGRAQTQARRKMYTTCTRIELIFYQRWALEDRSTMAIRILRHNPSLLNSNTVRGQVLSQSCKVVSRDAFDTCLSLCACLSIVIVVLWQRTIQVDFHLLCNYRSKYLHSTIIHHGDRRAEEKYCHRRGRWVWYARIAM